MHAIHDLGFPYCTPIQAQVLGFTLRGQDAIGRAQTGTGKTAAFLISIITQLLQTPPPKERYMGEPRALIIALTRELVVQIARRCRGADQVHRAERDDLRRRHGLRQATQAAGSALLRHPGSHPRPSAGLQPARRGAPGHGRGDGPRRSRPHARHGLHPAGPADHPADPAQGRTPDSAVLGDLHRRRDEPRQAVDRRSGDRRDRAGERRQRHRRAACLRRGRQRQVQAAVQPGGTEQLGTGDGLRQPQATKSAASRNA